MSYARVILEQQYREVLAEIVRLERTMNGVRGRFFAKSKRRRFDALERELEEIDQMIDRDERIERQLRELKRERA